MSIGMIFLLVLTLLILFGVLQRVLDRMALTDRQALILVAAIFIGGWLPDLRIGMVSLNIGGALVPFGVCVYLFFHAGTAKERVRALVASVLTAAVIYVISLFFPSDPVTMPFDPMILYGLCGESAFPVVMRSMISPNSSHSITAVTPESTTASSAPALPR